MIEPPTRPPKDAEDVPRVDSVRHVGPLFVARIRSKKWRSSGSLRQFGEKPGSYTLQNLTWNLRIDSDSNT